MRRKLRIGTILLAVCGTFLWAYGGNGAFGFVTTDSLQVDVQDTCRVEIVGDSLSCRVMHQMDSLRFSWKRPPVSGKTFHFEYDAFREQMREPWLGELLKNILFR